MRQRIAQRPVERHVEDALQLDRVAQLAVDLAHHFDFAHPDVEFGDRLAVEARVGEGDLGAVLDGDRAVRALRVNRRVIGWGYRR